jgi:hypothetical protein
MDRTMRKIVLSLSLLLIALGGEQLTENTNKSLGLAGKARKQRNYL